MKINQYQENLPKTLQKPKDKGGRSGFVDKQNAVNQSHQAVPEKSKISVKGQISHQQAASLNQYRQVAQTHQQNTYSADVNKEEPSFDRVNLSVGQAAVKAYQSHQTLEQKEQVTKVLLGIDTYV